MKKQVAIYNRISKGKDIDRSLKEQMEIIESYQRKNDVEIKVYTDIHKSTIDDREAYNKLITDIFEGKIESLIVLGNLDRLTRKIKILAKIEQIVEVQVVDKNGDIMQDTLELNLGDWLGKSFEINFERGDFK